MASWEQALITALRGIEQVVEELGIGYRVEQLT